MDPVIYPITEFCSPVLYHVDSQSYELTMKKMMQWRYRSSQAYVKGLVGYPALWVVNEPQN